MQEDQAKRAIRKTNLRTPLRLKMSSFAAKIFAVIKDVLPQGGECACLPA